MEVTRVEQLDEQTVAPAGESSALTDLVIITGFSGAGKSTAMAVFEDEGYFCVDNLPSEMIRALVDLFMHTGSKVQRAAVVSDVRGGTYFEGFATMLDELRTTGVKHRVLFLDVVIDTSGLTAAMLRRKLADELLPSRTPGRLAVTFESFGFKYGPTRDPDLLLDVRFLPNPHYESDLRPLTGDDQQIVDFINRDGALDAFYDRLHPLLDYLLPQYLAEGKAHLVVAIGCTGGRHRSVAIASHLAARYNGEPEYLVHVVHRDVSRPA